MPSKRRLRWAALPIAGGTAALLAGCTTRELNGFLPGFVEGQPNTTDQTGMIGALWVNSWIVLLVVGLVTWGLLFWAAVVYRRRKGQTGLPVQLRYNMPIEIFFTIVPLILVVGFFAFTARDQAIITADHKNPDVTIAATGKQWSWDFEYLGKDPQGSDTVWTMGVQARPDANGNYNPADLPTLYLPVDKKVTIKLDSRDVIHSFWIIDFLYKEDMVPGHPNSWSFVPTRVGDYVGRCAELCGEYHSMMLFNVKVVSQADYDAHLAELRAEGNTGPIGDAYSRNQNLPGTGAPSKVSH